MKAQVVLRLPQVKLRVGLSRSAIYNRVAEGSFPRSIPLGGRARGWLEDEIDRWIDRQARSRESEPKPAVRVPQSLGLSEPLR